MWSVAAPLPAELLQACARFAACHVWCDVGDVVYASEGVAALHSVKAGARTLRLPRPRRVIDAMTGELVAKEAVDTVTVDVTPPTTRIFILE